MTISLALVHFDQLALTSRRTNGTFRQTPKMIVDGKVSPTQLCVIYTICKETNPSAWIGFEPDFRRRDVGTSGLLQPELLNFPIQRSFADLQQPSGFLAVAVCQFERAFDVVPLDFVHRATNQRFGAAHE